MKELSNLAKISLDVYTGIMKDFSVEKGNEAIKMAISEACGGEFNFNSFRKNKYEVFAVITEMITPAVGTALEGIFSDFIDYQNVALGDQIKFEVEDMSLFDVYTTALANGDIPRQKLYNSELTLSMTNVSIKIYAELYQFMAGRINWTTLVNRVTKSYVADVSKKIYAAVYGAYGSLTATYGKTGSYSEDVLKELVAHVEAATGQPALIVGTKKALSKINVTTVSEKMKEEVNQLGYYGKFYSNDVRELPQAHTVGTTTFAVSDSVLFIIPNGEKFIKVGLEGDTYIFDNVENVGARNDMQMEFLFTQRAGVAVLSTSTFAMYKLA